ncbi:MAG TPA: TerB family tellurite resistance protein [Gammaproteobacteria bacterium]
MLKALADLFDRALGGGGAAEASPEQRRHAVQVATALLLVEVERADFSEDVTERDETFRLVKQFFELSDEDAAMLVAEARAEADHAASLQTFTRRLHETLTVDEKHRIVEMLWRVALADNRLDKHEDHLVRKISELLYVSHSDLIRIRNRVRETAGR